MQTGHINYSKSRIIYVRREDKPLDIAEENAAYMLAFVLLFDKII